MSNPTIPQVLTLTACSLIIIGVLLLVGCKTDNEKVEQSRHEFKLVNTMDYYMDDRTGLCFAVVNGGYQSGMMANVPCDALNNHYHASHRPATKDWP